MPRKRSMKGKTKADVVREFLATCANPAIQFRAQYNTWVAQTYGDNNVAKAAVSPSQFATVRRKYCESKSVDPKTGANQRKTKNGVKRRNGHAGVLKLNVSDDVARVIVRTLYREGESVDSIASQLDIGRAELLQLLRSADDHDARFLAQCYKEDEKQDPQKVIDALSLENAYLRWRMEGQSKGFIQRLVRELAQEG